MSAHAATVISDVKYCSSIMLFDQKSAVYPWKRTLAFEIHVYMMFEMRSLCCMLIVEKYNGLCAPSSGGSNWPEEKTTDNSDEPKKDVKAVAPTDDAQSRIQATPERFLAPLGAIDIYCGHRSYVGRGMVLVCVSGGLMIGSGTFEYLFVVENWESRLYRYPSLLGFLDSNLAVAVDVLAYDLLSGLFRLMWWHEDEWKFVSWKVGSEED
ncbi:hypothetical protein Tco_1195493 [Tanacetum coccineum]